MNTIGPEHPLYFRRDRLAEGCLALLEEHGGRWILLSAPSGSGKTGFLKNELTDAAQGRGRTLLYYSFETDAATVRFIRWLTEGRSAIEPGRLASVLANAVADLGRRPDRPILALDEFPKAAADPKNAEFIAAFRSALDTHRRLPVVFTSSRPALEHAVFNDTSAPFFNFATRLPFELQKSEFLPFAHGVLGRFRPEFTPEALAAVYSAFAGRIGAIVDFLQSVLLVRPLNVAEEAERRARKAVRFPVLSWDTMPPAHREALFDLASGAGAYPPGVNIGRRTSALRALCKKALLFHSGRGEYAFTDEAARHWILEHAPDHHSIARIINPNTPQPQPSNE